jgi:hypothetical protein
MSMRDGLGATPSNLTVPLTDEGVSAEDARPDRSHGEIANTASAHAEIAGKFSFILNLLS